MIDRDGPPRNARACRLTKRYQPYYAPAVAAVVVLERALVGLLHEALHLDAPLAQRAGVPAPVLPDPPHAPDRLHRHGCWLVERLK